MNIQHYIPAHFRAEYLAREKDYAREELEFFYSLPDNHPLKDTSRCNVLTKRKKFYHLWCKESDMNNFNEQRYYCNEAKKLAEIKHIEKQFKNIMDDLRNLFKSRF